MDILTYALAKSYTDKALLGVGTIKGAPCTVKSQTEDDEYVYVTLGWENNLGVSEETVVKIKKGADGAPGEPGPAGDPGPQGVSITKIEKIKTEGLIDTYQISFSDNTTFEYTVSNGSDAVIDDNETGLTKTFSSDKISKTFATIEEVNKRIPQYDVLPTPTEAFGGKVVQFIGTTTEDYIHNYFYECVQVEGNYKWVNTVVQNVPTKVSELTNDSNFVTETELNEKGYLTEHQDISGKVDKEEGKSLIADSEITRLSTVKNYDDSVVKEDIATIKTDYATKTYVGEQIAAADHLKREIVTEVPTVETAAENVIYMLKVESTVGADKYKEYMLIDGEVACVGDTSVDLTDYAKKDEIPTELPANGGNADTAASVPWSGITEKPSSYTPSSHEHTTAEITDFPSSMPASDVPAWAKESTKPSYTKAEVGLENVDNTADSAKTVYAAQRMIIQENRIDGNLESFEFNPEYSREHLGTVSFDIVGYDKENKIMTYGNSIDAIDTRYALTTFTNNDSTTGDPTPPSLLASGERHASILSKVSTIFKNVRWLLSKMGTTDISAIGNGTVTGALSTLNSNMNHFTVEDISFTENVKSGTVYAHKNGNCVTITAWSQATQDLGTSNSYASIALLQQQYIPNYSLLTYCCINNDILCQIIVGNDGLIKIGYSLSLTNNSTCDIPNGVPIYFTITYVI